MLKWHGPASLVTGDWTGTWPQGGSPIGRWTKPIRSSKICLRRHRDASQSVVGTEKERLCGVGSWGVDFSATYALMRKLVGQEKQENQADRQRETEKKVHEDRECESKSKGSCLHLFPVGEQCSVFVKCPSILSANTCTSPSVKGFLVLAKLLAWNTFEVGLNGRI